MAKLKPWYHVVMPREDLRDNRALEASEFAVHLDHIRTKRDTVSKDYSDPKRFFERTYLTGSLLELSSQIVRRLSGIQLETSAVFNMATQFGGGKSHSLATLFHLASHGDVAKTWKGVDSILSKAQVTSVPKADVAVFVGTEFDVLKGRGGDGEPIRRTPWGEIAWQLGGEAGFAIVAEHDAQGIAPAGDVIRQMLPKGPTLILMDELLNYVSSGRKLGMRDQFFNFMQNLCEEARARNNLALCVSIPASELEMNPDDQRDHDSLKKLCDRVGKAILMSADKEMSEIIRRRLFEWNGLNDDAKATISAYADWSTEHAKELVGIDRDTIYEKFKSCYPFHPAVISVFERKWQSLPRFQKTRGVLRLLALWVSHNFKKEHWTVSQEPLITVGLAPIDDPIFRAAILEQLGSNDLETPVTVDIGGKQTDSNSLRLDKEATEAIRKAQIHRKVATTIFFESNGGMSQSRAEATLPEIKSDVGGPDVNLADVETVLEGLASNCFYLQWDRNRYRFGLTPNLNQVLVSRRGAVQNKAIDERIRKQTESLFGKHSVEGSKFIERRFFPTRSNDVPEIPKLTLVIMGLDHAAEDKNTLALMESIVRDSGTSGRTMKSALIFAVADPSENTHDMAREALAWEDINDDEETKNSVDEGQLKLLERNLKGSRRDLDEAILRAYNHLYLLGKDNKLCHIPLGNITSSGAGLVQIYLERLGSSGGRDEVVEFVAPRKLLNYWPTALTEWSTKAVRDAFYSSPQLPRLPNPDAVKRMIANGVLDGLFGYATKDSSGRLKLEKLKESLLDAEVEISDDVYILKGDDALKLKEPPRLAGLTIKPDQVSVKIGEQVSFQVAGVDQYGDPIPVAKTTWSASTGNITAQGLFTAGDTGGLFNVNAKAGASEAFAEVRVTTANEPITPPPLLPADRYLRWRGIVPSQKWMNFYTKVLSKFANTPGLKIEVSFEVKIDKDHADSKAAETRSGLKELGLDDHIEGF